MDLKLKSSPRRTIETLALALLVGGSVSVASASVTYQVNNGGLESFNVEIDHNVINGALAGGILIKQSSDASMPKSYTTVCTDIEGTLYLGQSYQYNVPPAPFAGETGVDPTWGAINTPAYLSAHTANSANAAQAIQNAAYLFYNYGNLTSAGMGGTTEQKAALQLAVWEALYDTAANGQVITGSGARFEITGGADGAAINQANDWIAALNGSYDYTGYLLTPATGNNSWWNDGKPPQELLYGVVPEAPTVIAGALLLLPFAASTFRILRRKRTA